MLTNDSFNGLLGRLGIAPSADLFRELVGAYSSPDRHYHSVKHIVECLRALKLNDDLAERPAEIEIALWFHDAIYDTHRNDNEERSADWAGNFLERGGLHSESVARVYNLIIATKHDTPVQTADEQLLVDIDLGILGQSAAVFAAYDAAIRREYHWVPAAQYRSGRTSVLRSFLERPRIYNTERFVALYESQARENIAHAISELAHGT